MVGGRDRDRTGDPLLAKLIRKHDLVVWFSLVLHHDARFYLLFTPKRTRIGLKLCAQVPKHFLGKAFRILTPAKYRKGASLFPGENGWPSVLSSSEITHCKPTYHY